MSFRVRSSKFRHVFGSPYKKEVCYEGIKISKNAHDNNFCAVNPKFLSVITETAGGGSFVVLPLEKVGRVDINTPKVCGHTGPILDIKWNPFNDNIISSASEDATVKLWQIPDGGLESSINDWMVDLHGHTRRVGYIEWHPTAENVLLSAGYDFNCILWNVETAEPVNIISVHPENIFSLAWNHDGSLFATTCKDKNLRVVDPRQGNVVSECASHQGTKASKVTFLGNKNKLFTTGSSKMCERQYGIWDMRNMSSPLRMEEMDSSSGIMFQFYDQDTNVMFLAGKGDGNIRYFEVVDEAPHTHYLSQYQSSSPQRGFGFMPKRGIDSSKCEMVRFYKLHTTKSLVEPISMIVPRKSEVFQDDIYPPTASSVPSLSADEWIAGSNRDPILMSLKDGQIMSSSKSNTSKAIQRKTPLKEVNNNNTLRDDVQSAENYSYNPRNQPNSADNYSNNSRNQPKTKLNGSRNCGNPSNPTNIQTIKTNNGNINLSRHRSIENSSVNNKNSRIHSTIGGTMNIIPTDSFGITPRKLTVIHSSQINSKKTPIQSNQNRKLVITTRPKNTSTASNSSSESPRSSYGRESRATVTKVQRSVVMTPVHSITKAPKLKATETSGPAVNRITRNTHRSNLVSKEMMLGKEILISKRNEDLSRQTATNKTFYRPRNKDGGIVPTITTYKAMKRGQSLAEPPSSGAKRSSPMTKAASLDHTPDRPEKIPASVRNIAKLSAIEDESGTATSPDHVDVQNRIGMFENKNHSSPPSPERRWSQQYHNSVKTEVTAATNHTYQENNEEYHHGSPVTHQMAMSSNQIATATSIARSQPDQTGLTQKQPVNQTGVNRQSIANNRHTKPPILSTNSIDQVELSDDSEILGLTSPITSPGIRTQQQTSSANARKKHNKHYSYRRRRENKILNESSDMETFTTPPTSPGGETFEGGASTPALSMWNQNPVFSEEAAASSATVDISALDDALQDFEELSKTFPPSTQPVAAKKSYSSSNNNQQSYVQPLSPGNKQRPIEVVPQQKSSSGNDINKEKVYNNSKTKIDREISRSKPDVSKTSGYSNEFAVPLPPDSTGDNRTKYDLSSFMSVSSGHIPTSSFSGAAAPASSVSYDRISPDLKMSGQIGNESREMIDIMSNEAPDNTLIKPSKLRASLRSKRRHTQEITMREEKSPSPGLNGNSVSQETSAVTNFQRGNSFRDKPISQLDKDEGTKLRRVSSMRDRTRNSREMNIVEMTSATSNDNSSIKKKELNNNHTSEMNGRISPTQVSRPLQLALDMETGKKPQRRDSFKSSTRVQLHSPTMVKSPTTVKSPTILKSPSPVQVYQQKGHSPVQTHPQVQTYSSPSASSMHSYTPLHSYSPGPIEKPSGKFTFTTTSVDDKSPDKVLISPVDGSGGGIQLGRRRSSSNMDDTENKIHVKKVWSPRSPSQPEPDFVYENGADAAPVLPNTDPELRKAYFRQLEEIESLKHQITFKDKRIRQLEEELRMLRLPPGDDESNC